MTVYVTDGDDCSLMLWADTADEVLIAAAMAGVSDFAPQFREWQAFCLTEDQWALAIADGAVITDKFEPAAQYARAKGRTGLLQSLEASRRHRAARRADGIAP